MKNNNKLFANYEVSSIAKEKGFDDICFALVDKKNRIHLLNISDSDTLKFDQLTGKYNGEKCVPSPLLAQLLYWLETKNIFFDVLHTTSKHYECTAFINVGDCTDGRISSRIGERVYTCCEKNRTEAILKCIKSALNHVK